MRLFYLKPSLIHASDHTQNFLLTFLVVWLTYLSPKQILIIIHRYCCLIVHASHVNSTLHLILNWHESTTTAFTSYSQQKPNQTPINCLVNSRHQIIDSCDLIWLQSVHCLATDLWSQCTASDEIFNIAFGFL